MAGLGPARHGQARHGSARRGGVAAVVRVAIVGGGIFGATAAVHLARAGHDVDLLERHSDILMGGSRANCGRIHRGYHYPRSEPTARATMAGADSFAHEYSEALHPARHHYVIANDSRVDGSAYVAFLNRLGLRYHVMHSPLVRDDTTQVTVWAAESLLNVGRLRSILRRQLISTGVRIRTGETGGPDLPGYDLTVLATYGAHTTQPFRFEVTEIAVVELPRQFTGQSYVVLDGPFCCIDPLPGTGLHLLYDVVHSVHHATIGYTAEIPEHLVPLVDAGLLHTPHTRFAAMTETAAMYFHGLEPRYRGSMFTVRAVLPDVDATDERPTLVERRGNTIAILSGKLDTAVTAAQQVVTLTRELVPA